MDDVDSTLLVRLASVYVAIVYGIYFAARQGLGKSGGHFFVTGVHSAIASALAVATLWLWTSSNDNYYYYYYSRMLVSSATFMMADLPIWIFNSSSSSLSSCFNDSDLRSTIVHHLASTLGSLLLLKPENASVPIAGLTTLVELSTVLFCIRQVLRSQQSISEPTWLNQLFYSTHVILRGPVLLCMVVTEIPSYILLRNDNENLLNSSSSYGRWIVVVVCGIPFFVLNQIWNFAIIKKYLPQSQQQQQSQHQETNDSSASSSDKKES